MAKTQSKMKEYLEKQTTMNSFERLSKALGNTDGENEMTPQASGMDVDKVSPANAIKAETSTTETETATTVTEKPDLRGENKVITNRKMSRRQKRMLRMTKNEQSTVKTKHERPQPKYFCKF